MKLGVRTLGEIDEVEGESLATRFLYVGPLMFPLDGIYRTPRGDYEVPLVPRSVVLAYARTYTALVALLAAVGAGISLFHPQGQAWIALACAPAVLVAGILWWMTAFRLGRASEDDAERRRLLHAVTGTSAYPHMLPERVARNVLRGLERSWRKRHRAWRARACWRETLAAGTSAANLRYVAALALYADHVDPSPETRLLRARAWERLEAGTDAEPDRELQALLAGEEAEPADEEAASLDALPASVAERAARPPRRRRRRKALRMECPHCEKVSRIPRQCAGQRGLCPACRKAVEVPALQAAA